MHWSLISKHGGFSCMTLILSFLMANVTSFFLFFAYVYIPLPLPPFGPSRVLWSPFTGNHFKKCYSYCPLQNCRRFS